MAYRGRGGRRNGARKSSNNQQQQTSAANGDNNTPTTTTPSTPSTPSTPTVTNDTTTTTARKLIRPKFIKIKNLEPGTKNLNVVAKVVSVNVLVDEETVKRVSNQPPTINLFGKLVRNNRVLAEVVIGDETGTVILSLTSAKHLQAVQEVLQDKTQSIIIRGGRINLFKGYMRLKVDEPFGVVQILHRPHIQKLYSEELLKKALNDKWEVNTSSNVSSQRYKVVYENSDL